MSGVAGKPRQTRLHVLLLAAKSHKKRLGCGHIVDTLTTISTLQRVKRNRVLSTMGAYQDLHKLPRGVVSIADEFGERVEAARAAANEGEFGLYIAAQGRANVPRDSQTVCVARNVTDEVNTYKEDIEGVVGIYAPHLGSELVHITRLAEWRIVAFGC